MANHTPGPWSIGEFDGVFVESETAKRQICDILLCEASDPEPYATTSEAEALANARLIAAAPELLAALEAVAAEDSRAAAMSDYAASPDFAPLRRAIATARAAIAKATGQD